MSSSSAAYRPIRRYGANVRDAYPTYPADFCESESDHCLEGSALPADLIDRRSAWTSAARAVTQIDICMCGSAGKLQQKSAGRVGSEVVGLPFSPLPRRHCQAVAAGRTSHLCALPSLAHAQETAGQCSPKLGGRQRGWRVAVGGSWGGAWHSRLGEQKQRPAAATKSSASEQPQVSRHARDVTWCRNATKTIRRWGGTGGRTQPLVWCRSTGGPGGCWAAGGCFGEAAADGCWRFGGRAGSTSVHATTARLQARSARQARRSCAVNGAGAPWGRVHKQSGVLGRRSTRQNCTRHNAKLLFIPSIFRLLSVSVAAMLFHMVNIAEAWLARAGA